MNNLLFKQEEYPLGEFLASSNYNQLIGYNVIL